MGRPLFQATVVKNWRGFAIGAVLAFLAVMLLPAAPSFLSSAAAPEMASPRQGDAATYDVAIQRYDHGGGGSVPYTIEQVEVAWDAPDRLRLRLDYDWHAGDRPYQASVFQTVHYGRQDWIRNEERYFDQVYSADGVKVPGITVGAGGRSDVDLWVRGDNYQGRQGPCGFQPPFAGEPIPANGAVEVGGRCHREWNGTDRFRFVGHEEVAGLTVARFDHIDLEEVSIWYHPDIPFPVRVRDHFADLLDPAKTVGHVFEWTLVGHKVGLGDAAVSEPPMPPASVGTVPFDGFVPDESRIEHAFPLHTAWEHLLANDPDFRDFVESVPGAYTAVADQWTGDDELGRSTWRWALVVTDGNAHIDRWVQYEPGLPRDQVALDPRPVSLSIDASSWDSGLPSSVRGIYPPKQSVPDHLPDLAAAMETASAALGVEADWWEMHILCTDRDCSPDRVRVNLDVGRQRGWANEPLVPNVPGAVEPPGFESDLLRFRPDGTVTLDRRTTIEPDWASVLDVVAPSASTQANAWTSARYDPPVGAAMIAAGIGAALLGLLGTYWNPIKATVIGGFSRVSRSGALDNAVRSSIHDAITADPGVHFQELRRRTSAGRGALEHHLRKLTDTGLVQVADGGGYACYFPAGATDRRIMAASGVLKAAAAKRIVAHLLAHGSDSPRAIAAAIGASPGTVSHHLKRLREAGVVTGGGRAPYRPSAHAAQALGSTETGAPT